VIRVGLTGSIGMGKSTTAGLFAREGDAVHDADAAVHRLYRGAAVEPVGAAFPGVVVNGAVDRERLADAVIGDEVAIARLEAIVHPLVRADEARFLDGARRARHRIAVLDVPLLFETGRAAEMDAVVVASAPACVQRRRVLARPGMTEERFLAILARQTPDAQKRAGAHFVVDTAHGVDDAARQVAAIRKALLSMACPSVG